MVTLLFFSKPTLPTITAITNNQFKQLGGNTTNLKDSLLPSVKGFLHYTPTALENAFLKPSTNQLSLTYIPSFIENTLLFCLILFILFHFQNLKQNFTNHFFLFFGFGTVLYIGFAVPVTGAIIRYKSILLPFIVVAILPYMKLKWKINKHIIN
jgi:hypothetical protein